MTDDDLLYSDSDVEEPIEPTGDIDIENSEEVIEGEHIGIPDTQESGTDVILRTGTPLVNVKHENFVLFLLEGHSQSEAARLAGYEGPNLASVASHLLTLVKVRMRYMELQDILSHGKVMSVARRKEILSEIGEATPLDFQNKHGVLDPLDKDATNIHAIAEVTQEFDPDGLQAYPVKVKLYDKIAAIREINKMERIYETGTTVKLQQAIVNVSVVSPRARDLTDRIIAGEKPEGD